MCGIVGIIGDVNFQRQKIFKQLLTVDVLRGDDSTGMFFIDNNDKCHVDKRATDPAEFFLYKSFSTFKANKCIIGHNRSATRGYVSDFNAHPFVFGDITLVHNGTLYSTTNLRSKHTVDSAQICEELTGVDPIPVLEKLMGAYALVWHDDLDNTINIARNTERPLSACNDDDGTIYLASEKKMLEWILDRNNVKIKDWYEIKPGALYSKCLESKDKASVTEFTPHVPKKIILPALPRYNYPLPLASDTAWLKERGLVSGQEVTLIAKTFARQSRDNAQPWGWAFGTTKEATKNTLTRLYMRECDFKVNSNYIAKVNAKGKHGNNSVILLSCIVGVEDTIKIMDGTYVTKKQFDEDLDNGCISCKGTFSIQDRATGIEWYGESMPVHKDCYNALMGWC